MEETRRTRKLMDAGIFLENLLERSSWRLIWLQPSDPHTNMAFGYIMSWNEWGRRDYAKVSIKIKSEKTFLTHPNTQLWWVTR